MRKRPASFIAAFSLNTSSPKSAATTPGLPIPSQTPARKGFDIISAYIELRHLEFDAADTLLGSTEPQALIAC
jgi:hypothetical protein